MSLYSPSQTEKDILAYWEAEGTPQKATSFKPKKKFFLLDGPPYVNYDPHVGHILTTTLKDVWGRFKSLQGHSVWFQPGFDCNGLPIEHAVEKQLGIRSKQDIEQLGVSRFINECKALAQKNLPVWMGLYKKLGAWKGWLDPYLTYTNPFIESGWWSVKQLYEKGYLVEGLRTGFWCTHCETVLAGYEVTDSYKNLTDPSVVIKFPVSGQPRTFLLVWTTTPWTLPANVAILVHPDELYATVEAGETKEKYILAEKRLSVLDDLHLPYKILKKVPGRQLEGLRYQPVLPCPLQDELARNPSAHTVYVSIPLLKVRQASKVASAKGASREESFGHIVEMDSGTGLVHTAPGHGEIDNKIGRHYNLPEPSPVNEKGLLTEAAGQFAGLYVKKADPLIIQALGPRLLSSTQITHSYPLCWRCKTPLIYRMSRQWYLKLDVLKPAILKANRSVRWLPAFGGERFHEVVETAPDWAITRQRYWGIPLPIWNCEKCKSQKVIGSVADLRRHSSEKLPEDIDLHKDSVDKVFLRCSCGSLMARSPDIMDVWFDSGITPWASLGYPFKNKQLFNSLFPIDLIDESQDQVRGWFYSLMTTGFAIFGKAPYKTVCLNGWVLDEKGEKMSKSLGNVVWASQGLDQAGADALRLFYCSTTPPWDTQKFSLSAAKQLHSFLNIVWNIYEFADTYSHRKFLQKPVPPEEPEDTWLLSKLNSLVQTVTQNYEQFEFHLAGRALMNFLLNDLSRWYIKLVRDRIAPTSSDPTKSAAQSALIVSLDTSLRLLAPICPFITEKVFVSLHQSGSIHLSSFPLPDKKKIQPKLESQMSVIQQLAEEINAARAARQLKLRWPLTSADISSINPSVKSAIKDLHIVLENITNIQSISFVNEIKGDAFSSGNEKILLGQPLMDEALIRELIRAIQELRKKAALKVDESVSLHLKTDPSTQRLLETRKADLLAGVNASVLSFGQLPTKQGSLEFEGRAIEIGFERKAR